MSTQKRCMMFACQCAKCRGRGRKVPVEVARSPVKQGGFLPVAEPELYASTRQLTRMLTVEYGDTFASDSSANIKSDFAAALALDDHQIPKPTPVRETYGRSAEAAGSELELHPGGRYSNAQRIRAALNVAGYDPTNEAHFRMVKTTVEHHLQQARQRPPECFDSVNESLDANF